MKGEGGSGHPALPLFVGSDSGDFHLLSSSPAINVGVALASVTGFAFKPSHPGDMVTGFATI
jgi:hypothetical protein